MKHRASESCGFMNAENPARLLLLPLTWTEVAAFTQIACFMARLDVFSQMELQLQGFFIAEAKLTWKWDFFWIQFHFFYSFIQINISPLLTCAYTALSCMLYFYLMKEKNTKITEVRSFSFFLNCVIVRCTYLDCMTPDLTPLLGICQKWRRLLLAFNIIPIKNP